MTETLGQRTMHLGLFFESMGQHVAAWRDPDVDASARQKLSHFQEVARTAERGKLDFIFSADVYSVYGPDNPAIWSRTTGMSRHEPFTVMAALAATTSNIGMVVTASTSFYQPMHVARLFASLDQISGGRMAWNIVTSHHDAEAANFGIELPAPEARYDRADEFTDVVLGLWDSWEDDAFIGDKESGLYIDPTKIHPVNHEDRYFSVRGPLNIPRSPQGHPVIVQAGASDAGRNLAAKYGELVFSVQQDLEEAKAFYRDIKTRAERFGRDPAQIKIMPGALVILGATTEEAQAKYSRLQGLIHPDIGVPQLSSILKHDLSLYPVDGPIPELSLEGVPGHAKVIVDMARRENLSIRETYLRVIGLRGHRLLFGTPSDVADELELWFAEGAADGYNIMTATLPEGLNDFVNLVVPELQNRGLFRTEYSGPTLRENLGLPSPENRFVSKPQIGSRPIAVSE